MKTFFFFFFFFFGGGGGGGERERAGGGEGVQMKIFTGKKFNIFYILVQNIDCGYTLEPPQSEIKMSLPQTRF